MNKPILSAITAATLILGGNAASARDLPFRFPDTTQAHQNADLLARAGNAVSTRLRVNRAGASNMWVYPTHGANTVYVSYATPRAEHVLLVEMKDARIAKLSDLTKPHSRDTLFASTSKVASGSQK